jgi:hypothetical protein
MHPGFAGEIAPCEVLELKVPEFDSSGPDRVAGGFLEIFEIELLF